MKFLKKDVLVTTSIDQRLNVWSHDSAASTLKLTSSLTHDVADVTSLQVLRKRLEMAVHVRRLCILSLILCVLILGTLCVSFFVALEFNTFV